MLALGVALVGGISPAVAQGAAGDLYVTSNDATLTTSTILRFNPATPGFSTFASTSDGASFLNFGPNGALYATNEDDGTVLRVDRNGVVSTIASSIPGAYGIAREPSGSLVVADYNGAADGGLTRVDPATGAKQHLASESPLGASFYGVAVAPDGTIYVAQNDAGNLLRIPPGGSPTVFADQLTRPVDIEVDVDGTLLVSDQGTNPDTVVRIDPNTGASSPVATLPAGRTAYGLTRGADGLIYLADLGQDAVLRVDPKTGQSTQVFKDPALITAVDVEAEPPDCHGQLATIYGTPGNDTITGGPSADVIAGLGGRDKISGLGSGDVLCGGPGRDTLRGGSGKDRLYGDAGKDILKGGKGKDKLVGGGGRDSCPGHGSDKRKSC
jgi:streptogramin lyase